VIIYWQDAMAEIAASLSLLGSRTKVRRHEHDLQRALFRFQSAARIARGTPNRSMDSVEVTVEKARAVDTLTLEDIFALREQPFRLGQEIDEELHRQRIERHE
jgi:hypothetical protein